MCFSLMWLEQLVIWIIVIAAIIAVIRLLVPFLDQLTGMPIIGRVIMIVLWCVVAIGLVIIIFGLLSCVLGGSGTLSLPHPR